MSKWPLLCLPPACWNHAVSDLSRNDVLATTRRMLRGFPGSPDPRQHAKRLYQELLRMDGRSPAEADILTLGRWLETRPTPTALKERCAAPLARLS